MVPRLREPRSLYALTKELGPQQAARWPSDLQVINERIRHIQTAPSEPEPFYKTTGFEKRPMVRGEANGGRVVFCYETNSSFFMKSRVGGSRNGCDPCAVNLESESDTTLIFESRFESGNLGKAVQIGEDEYELWLRYDLYTNKHTQWFYFRVTNTRADKEYRFTIVNLMKPDSLYNDGMRPVMYSEKEAALNKVGWRRAGNNIKYYRNNVRYEHGRGDHYFYSVTWTIKMAHDNDTVYFSHCYPYTYTDLQDYLLELTNDPIKSRICKQRVLCRTLAGNLVYVLTITSSSQNPEDMKHKKAVVVTSRVHPGESNASWMMKGFLDFVTGSSPDAKLLRDTFIFKVVPMLNPDGVVVGNYRCSLAGRDLNRNYKTSLKDAYPSVYHTKSLIRKLLMERSIIVYCDLHGHSRRQNVFIYGCEQHPTHGISNYSGSSSNNSRKFHERVFPSMLSKNSPEKFCFKSCKFKVQKSKEGTGRVVIWNMGVQNSYTMEATFCGSSLGKKKGFHFNQHDFEMMGYHFCDTLLDYCDPDNTKYTKILADLEDKHKMEIITKIAQKGLQPDAVDTMEVLSTDTESSTGGSDSDVSDGPPVHLQYAAARPKKKKLKSKRDRDRARKEELKKLTATPDEKRLRNNQVKPLKPDMGKIQGQPIRYTSNSPKRPRSIDDRSNTGIPVFVQERFEEKQQKRHDYLEALTAAYISNNIPIVNDPGQESREQLSSRHSNRGSAGLTRPRTAALATAGVWAPTEVSLSRSSGDIHRVVHFRYSGSNDRPATHQAGVEGLCPHHEQTLANQLAAAQANSAGDAAFKISRLVARRDDRRSEAQPNMEDLLRAHLAHPSSFTPLDRRHKPHLLEVSAAQQRQTDALSRDKNGLVKTHPNPFDEASKKEDPPKPQAVATTSYVDSSTFSVSQIPEAGSSTSNTGNEGDKALHRNGHRDRARNGRKSRKGMREDEDDDLVGYQPRIQSATADVFDRKGPSSRPPRVKSAHSTPGMATALSSIQEIQRSLRAPEENLDEGGNQNNRTNANATGEYIQKLIKETNEEIEDLTHEIQEDIEKKQQLNKMREESGKNNKQASHKQNPHEGVQSKVGADTKGSNGVSQSYLGIGYHGSTFVNDLSRLGGGERGAGGSSGSVVRGGGGTSATQVTTTPTSKPPTTGNEYISYTGSSMTSSDTSRPAVGPNLIVGGASSRRQQQQQQTSLEEEARRRNLKRQMSLYNTSSAPTALQQQLQQPCHSLSDLRGPTPPNSNADTSSLDYTNLGQPFRQISSSSYQGGASHAPTPSGIRLTKHNLVFKTDSTPTGSAHHIHGSTPRGPSAQLPSDDPEGDSGEQARSRSARSGLRQVIETVPTKISLMICSEHQEAPSTPSGHFLPLSRQGVRPSLYRGAQGRKK
ncbi:cytosolic carboxypeptidase 2 [Elysia marginata]|uniref:Cytosolic carboxypeptidase 2 n=1 Tax=Elysia marginata TaxID=1093978 RepID=A0AAV4JRY8_9GAST|nr:cytosolic carboxypeptidase 2 [Elysia marginata]